MGLRSGPAKNWRIWVSNLCQHEGCKSPMNSLIVCGISQAFDAVHVWCTCKRDDGHVNISDGKFERFERIQVDVEKFGGVFIGQTSRVAGNNRGENEGRQTTDDTIQAADECSTFRCRHDVDEHGLDAYREGESR